MFLIRMNVSRTKLVGVALAIVAATIWLFWPSVRGEFLAGDDVEYLQQSVRVHGLTWNSVKWAFTTTAPYYHPLPRLSHVLDYQIWGTNAVGHHATSVVLHALNAALVFGFLWTLLGATALTAGERLTVALWVAAVFAIHPLQVESVAWMSGRTQLLCTTFGIGSLWAYAAGGRRWMVWGLYVAALLCKPMAVFFPFVMLAMDYFPLRRHEQLGWGRLLWEKAGWIALAAAAGLATMIAKSQTGQLIPLAAVPLSERVFLAFESLTFYPLKLVWPSHLSPSYPMPPGLSLDQWPVLGSVLSVVMITVVAVIERRRVPMLVAGWGAYVILLLPVSGLMPTIVLQGVATRFAYVATLPLLLVAGGTGVWAWRRSTAAARLALIGLLAGQLCVFGVRARRLIPVWRNTETELRAELAEFPDSEEIIRDLAMVLLDQGRVSEALDYAQRDVRIAPHMGQAHLILGLVLGRLGRLPEAIAQYQQALRINPDSAEAHLNLGNALLTQGDVRGATAHYEEALRLKPDRAEAHDNLGTALAQAGRLPEAIKHWEEALKLRPDDVEAHMNLGRALEGQGRLPEAIEHYQQALKLRPDFAPARNALTRLGAGP
ncbi:MAG: tetratricopeptide repeat protein [Verrucomicrobiia bacterium]